MESVEVERLVRSLLSWPNSVLFNLLLKEYDTTPREVSTHPLGPDNRGSAFPLYSSRAQENVVERYLLYLALLGSDF